MVLKVTLERAKNKENQELTTSILPRVLALKKKRKKRKKELSSTIHEFINPPPPPGQMEPD